MILKGGTFITVVYFQVLGKFGLVWECDEKNV